MWKPLLLFAVAANTFLITASEGSSKVVTSSQSSAQNSSSSSSTYGSSSTSFSSSSASSSSSSASSSSSSSHTSGGHKTTTQPPCPPKCPKNEVFDPCPVTCPPRECGVNPAVILCAVPPKAGDPECQPGCRCRDGYLRNYDGICVPKDKCPICPRNEVYDICPAYCPSQRCDVDPSVIKCSKPPKAGDSACEPGCRCIDGYVRNDEAKCPRPHEVWDPCPPTCPPQTCESIYAKYNCSKQPCAGSKDCVGACRCEPGYLRNKIGECISVEDCKKCTGPHEYFSCGVACDNVCATLKKQNQTSCPIINIVCNPMCYCEADYARDKNNICIPIDQCPKVPPCGVHEIYSNCPPYECRPQQCSEVGFPIPCPAQSDCGCPGKPACICDVGYVRNDYGVCMPIGNCPSCGGDPNAVAGCGVNCGRHCSNYNRTDISCIQVCYDNACDCRDGFVLDDNTKKCVRPKDCTPVCGANEVYSNCSNGGCGPKKCSELGFKIGCVKMDQKYCIGGCICKVGYLRDDYGKCIPKTECPACGGDPNAITGCGVNCNRHCYDLNKEPHGCITICYDDGCDCREGFVFDDNTGKCVRPKNCTPQCGKNERFEQCPDTLCTPQNCSQLGFPWPAIPCPPPGDGPCPGPPGCVCIDDYVRDDKGNCIPKKDCPSCGGDPNAVSGCGVNCGKLCSNYDKGPVRCPKICYPNACDCRKGYVLDENTKKCVRPEDCTPQCGQNERYEQCPATLCTPQNCSQLGFPWPAIPCPPPGDGPCPGPPGCVCLEDYVRNDKGICIPKKDCPSCGGDPNAVSGCGVNCGRLCSNYNQGPVPCPRICYPNACDCKDGYVLDENIRKCVHPEDCTPICGVNEIYDTCGNGGCRRWNCSQPIICIDPSVCEGRCVCLNDYARADNGTCIPEDQCEKCNKPHEYWDACAPRCPPQTCESIDKKYKCPAEPLYCRGACRCEKGYYRNKIGDCITKKQCKKCTGPHEYFACGGACDNVCATINKQNQTNCPIKNIKCNPMCYCEKGYARNKKNICIPIEDCPPPQCADDERYEECPDNLCYPRYCSQLGFPIACPALSDNSSSDCPGKPGCVCDNGNVRDKNGKCIPKDQCPSCGGDPNAVSGCGINCGRHCSNYKNKHVICPLICKLNSCDCRKEYVYDDNIKKCVRPEDCTPTCGINEVYDNCANGGCRKRKCSQPIICIRPKECKGGCICQNGYTRNDNGSCIPIDQCPPEKCPDGERYEKCPDNLCVPRTCSQLGFPLNCTDPDAPCPGVPGCVCDNGNVRDDNGNCIPRDQCPSCGGDPNAVSGCGGNCGRRCSDYKKEDVACPLICLLNGCDCREGYVYDDNTNKCVRPEDCTPTCGVNEVYDSCANGGCRRWTCEEGILCIDPIKCEGGCICQDGYVRNDDGICIPVDQCPRLPCGPYERFEQCPPALCTPQTCSQLGFPIDCPEVSDPVNNCPGPPGCVCDYGYVRDDKGNCIRDKDCPSCGGDPNAETGCGVNCGRLCSNYDQGPVPCPKICYFNACDCKKGYVFDENTKKCVRPKDCTPTCGVNEVYDSCANGGCRRWTCEREILCIDPIICERGCICQDGYVRNDDGICIPVDQCPNECNKPHEYYDDCPPRCPPQTCESIGKKYHCPISTAVCKGACRCEKGYYRNMIGECISAKNCKKCTGPHEYFSCGSACDNVCATIYKQNKTNCPIINIKCNPKCYCEDGYARDENEICIPIYKCPVPPCGPNERFEQCPPALCTPQTCSQLGFPIDCPEVSDPVNNCPGPPGCVCDYGYVRDDKGNCIRDKDCPSCGGDPNAVTGCGVNCGRLCSNYDQGPVPCPKICYFNACDCKKGYVYDENTKKCVRPKDCTPVCGKDEVYSECINGGCIRQNCSQIGQPIRCLKIDPAYCIKGCQCIEGYLRAPNGTCVPEDQCPPPQCGPNERFEICPPAVCAPKKCTELGFPIDCPVISDPDNNCPGSPSCICDYGYVRDDKGNCIENVDCPSCGGDPNAVSGCGGYCGNLCSNYDKDNVTCPLICYFNACDCRKGYVYDENRQKCVLPKDCTPICGKDEVYSECINGGCQRKNCSQIGKPVPCVKIDPDCCIKGCLCKEGYLRAPNGTCVPEDQCPQQCNKPNEYYDKCAPTCPPQTCESIGKNYSCPKQPPPKCKGACRCKKGYYRNKIGECITEKECLKCPGEHEYFSCGSACDNVCATLHKQNQTNCPIKTFVCVPMCYCEEGYARNDKNVCIPIDQCPEPKCPKGQRFIQCPPALCAPQTCSQVGFPVPCPDLPPNGTCPEPPACVCNENSVKDDNGNCIPMKKCPSCGGDPNAVSGCGNHCGNQCSDYKNKDVVCPLVCYYNACDCKKGYVYDENQNKCVRPKDCSPTCGKNEVYDICANGGCNKRNCSQLGEPTICIDPIECQGGCVCQQGYLRANNGTCVPENQCPDPCRKPHEYYDACPPICPPQTCDSLGKAYPCPVIPPGGTQYCNGACRCEDGYYRNAIGQCISENDCLKCTGPNEYFSCGSACDNVCATLKKQNQTHCPKINKKCNPMCYCVEGYARDDNNICIPIEQCNGSCKGDPNAIPGCGINCNKHCYDYKNGPIGFCPDICQIGGCDCKENYFYDDNIGKCVLLKNCTPTCGENEVFSNCINGSCKKNYSQIGKPYVCVRPKDCIQGCLCKDGYLRQDNGTCVSIDQCQETCNGDPNAEPGCGINCGRRCSNYDKPPPSCALGCIQGGCDCKPDYVFDDNLGKCVLPKDCTPVCKRNEVYNTCANAGCDIRKCSELTKPNYCEDPEECIGDCVCVEGYLRDDNGVCAPIHECHPACGPHEVYDPCPANCPPNTCESIGKAYSCPADIYKNCRGTCVCESGYYRNLIGECISKKDCLKCTGSHEYFSCGEDCDNVCYTLNEKNQTNCPVNKFECHRRCYCEKGYARDSENACIPIEDCPAQPGREGGNTGTTSPPTKLNNTDIQARLNRGTITLSGEFIYQLTQSRPNENFVASPTSLLIPLAQITIFAIDLTLQQLLGVLNLNSKDEITSIYPDELEGYNNQQNVEFEVANRYFFSDLYELSQNFIEASQRYFDATAQNVDFNMNQAAAETINDFVSNETHGRIQNLVSPDSLNAYTVLVLVNAMYFKGDWIHQFNPNDTQKRDFTRRDNTVVQLDTMYQENTFKYAEDDTLGIQALEMQYKNLNFSFFAILPQQGRFDAIVQALRDPTVFENIYNSLKQEKVQVYLPKMLINTNLDLAEMLQKDNVTAMFDPSANGFTGILKEDKPLYVSAIVQKTFFQCDETGSEAAAATGVSISARSLPLTPPEKIVFQADDPFFFIIFFQENPVFVGAFVGGK